MALRLSEGLGDALRCDVSMPTTTKCDCGALRRRATTRGASSVSARTFARSALTRARCAGDPCMA